MAEDELWCLDVTGKLLKYGIKDCEYIETSAKNNEDCKEAFVLLIKKVARQKLRKKRLNERNNKQGQGECCYIY